MKEAFFRWLDGEYDFLSHILDAAQRPDLPRGALREKQREAQRRLGDLPQTQRVISAEHRVFLFWYRAAALLCCGALSVVFLYMTARVTSYGAENLRAMEVARRYVEQGVEETGAMNTVAGMILDYRAFDTLGESHVLFTALICVMVLLRRDSKNMRTYYEDYYRIRSEHYFPTERDPILRCVGTLLVPSLFLFGVYVLLGGHLGPGGGFSGGAILGGALVIFACAFGDAAVDRVLTRRRFQRLSFCALSFYSFAKGYVFFTGANGLENHIPKGTPGAILSAGLILPLDVAVGLVVACTMYGFYSLFRRGSIGGDDT